MEEIKDLINNINGTRSIQRNRKLFERLSAHFQKHGWFYGEIVGLIGAAVFQLLT